MSTPADRCSCLPVMMPASAAKMLHYIRRPDSKGNSAPGSPRGGGGHDTAQQAHHQQMQQRQQHQQQQHLLQQQQTRTQQQHPPSPPQTQQPQDAGARRQDQQQTQPRDQAPLHVAPLRVASRQQTLEAGKLPISKIGRYSSGQPSSATNGPTAGHSFGLHQSISPPRIRANSDGTRIHAPTPVPAAREHDAWEDSTVNSLLESDDRSVTGHIRRPSAFDPRSAPTTALPAPPHRPHAAAQSERSRPQPPATSAPEHPPFIIGDGGLLKVLDHSHGPGPSATTLNSSVQSGILAETGQVGEDPYVDKPSYDAAPKKQPPLKPTKLSFRHNRQPSRDSQDAAKDKRQNSVFSRQGHYPSTSPERYDRAPEDPRRIKLETDPRAPSQRSTQFYDIDTPGRTPAPEDDDDSDDDNLSDPPSQGDEATVTLRTRTFNSNNQPPASPTRGAVSNGKPLAPAHSVNGFRPLSISRTNSNHGKLAAPLPPAKKRRMSLDYDDHMLHRMSYSELKNEAFDHDPARAAVQTAKPPSGDSLAEKLEHYKGQDENAQHHFFTQISVAEWDECGDWFLERFGEVVGRIKAARREKRKIVARFEEQISAREDIVRGRMENIERTLASLKQEGEGMMKGKEVDL